jgi:hypothetical protein
MTRYWKPNSSGLHNSNVMWDLLRPCRHLNSLCTNHSKLRGHSINQYQRPSPFNFFYYLGIPAPIVSNHYDGFFDLRNNGGARIKGRQLGVGFRDLRVVGLGASASHQPTLGSMLNPLNALDAIQDFRHPPLRDILQGFEGVVRPGEMLCQCLGIVAFCSF